AAEMPVHMATDLGRGGPRVLREKFRALDQHAVVAVAALWRLLLDESLLQWMQRWRLRQALLLGIPGRQAFERGHRLVRDIADRGNAGADFDPVSQHRTGAALSEPAAKARPAQLKLVGEDIKQRCIRACTHRPLPPIDLNLEFVSHWLSPRCNWLGHPPNQTGF